MGGLEGIILDLGSGIQCSHELWNNAFIFMLLGFFVPIGRFYLGERSTRYSA